MRKKIKINEAIPEEDLTAYAKSTEIFIRKIPKFVLPVQTSRIGKTIFFILFCLGLLCALLVEGKMDFLFFFLPALWRKQQYLLQSGELKTDEFGRFYWNNQALEPSKRSRLWSCCILLIWKTKGQALFIFKDSVNPHQFKILKFLLELHWVFIWKRMYIFKEYKPNIFYKMRDAFIHVYTQSITKFQTFLPQKNHSIEHNMQHFQELSQALHYIETLHHKTMDFDLTRIGQVRDKMALFPRCPIISTAGTNGKGSVCAMLSSMLAAAGFRVGTYTSPHLLEYNERIRINMQAVDSKALLDSFQRIEAARGDISLSYFEFGTLAAVDIFMRENVDVMVLEVGLGGRLDAVNIFDADCAIVTQIDLDHTEYLGDTREAIAQEKAGIFRPNAPVICADEQAPEVLAQTAAALNAPFFQIGRDFAAQKMSPTQWNFVSETRPRAALPLPALRGDYQIKHAAAAIAALDALRDRLPVNMQAIRRGLVEVHWPARFQVLPGRPLTVLDLAHNPHAARALAQNLPLLPFTPRRLAVFSALADKDLSGIIAPLRELIDLWLIAPLDNPRALDLAGLEAALKSQNIVNFQSFNDIAAASQAAHQQAKEDDQIVVFGSFFTVSAYLEAQHRRP